MAQRAVQAGVADRSLAARVLWYAVRDRNLYLMLLPAFAIFFIFRYVPIFNGLIIPFVDYDLVGGQWASPWVGFKWFRQFFEDPFFVRIIRNTLLLGALSLVFGFPARSSWPCCSMSCARRSSNGSHRPSAICPIS